MARLDFARPGGQWAPEMVPGANDYYRWDANCAKLINGDLGGTWNPTSPIVIGGAGGLVSSIAKASGGVATASAGRIQIASSAGDFPQFPTSRSRTVAVPLDGNVFSPVDVSSPETFQWVRDDAYGWGVKGVSGTAGFILSIPGRYLHIGAQLLQATLTYVVTKRPVAPPATTFYLIFYGVAYTGVQTFANPSILSATTPPVTGNIENWTATHGFTAGQYVVPLTLPLGAAYYYKCTTTGTTSGTEPSWPTVVGATVTDGTVVWTCTGLVGATLAGGETANTYYANGAPQALTFQYDGAGGGTYNNVISPLLRYAVLIASLDPTVLITGLKLTFGDITSMAFE
jgi:hypothetical protein